MDFLQALRLQNIFGVPGMIGNDLPSQGGITGNMPNSAPMAPPPQMAQPQQMPNVGYPDVPVTAGLPDNGGNDMPIYQPQHTAEDAYNNMINQYPQDQGHGKLARLGAALLAGAVGWDNPVTGVTLGQGVLNYGHNKKVQAWKDQIDPMEKAANLERQENTNQATLGVRVRGQNITQDKNTKTNEIQKGRIQVSQERLKLDEYRAGKKNLKFDFGGPTVLITDPETGKITDSGVNTGKLTEQDKIELQGSNQIAAIDERNAGKSTKRRPMEIPDPNDPTGIKRIGVWVTEDGHMSPITAGDVSGGTATPGAPSLNPNTPIGAPVKPGAPNPAADKDQKMQVVRQKAQDALSAMDDLIDDKDQLRDNVKQVVGTSRVMGLQYFPGSKARSAEVAINNFKANQIISVIAEMKSQSRTGATGFGALSAKELDVLDKAANKLDPSMGEEDFRKELVKIRERLKKVLLPADGMNPTDVIKKKTAQQLWEENGGK